MPGTRKRKLDELTPDEIGVNKGKTSVIRPETAMMSSYTSIGRAVLRDPYLDSVSDSIPVQPATPQKLKQFVEDNQFKPVNWDLTTKIPRTATMHDACCNKNVPAWVLRFSDLRGDRRTFAQFCAAKVLLEPDLYPDVGENLLRRYWSF